MQVVLVYLQPFRRSLLLKNVSQPKIAKKITKTPDFGGSRSFKIIDVDIHKKLVFRAYYAACLCLSATVFTLD